MSGWISVSPWGRIPSFGFAGAADAFVDTCEREHAATTSSRDATRKTRKHEDDQENRLAGMFSLLCRRELISFLERLARVRHELYVGAPAPRAIVGCGMRIQIRSGQLGTARVGDRV